MAMECILVYDRFLLCGIELDKLIIDCSSVLNLNLNLNLNRLLVKRQIDNPSLGAVTGGKLGPSSHKRGELRYTII